MAGRQIQGQGGRRERLLTPHDLAGIITAQQGFITGPIDYNSLINKPVIPSHLTDLDTVVSGTQLNSLKTKVDGIQAGAQVNVQSDWNAISGDAFILNKPTLATVAITGSYNDLSSKPTALPPNGPAGGSLTGTYPNPGVIVPVSSVFGRTGAVVAANGDYNTGQVTEGTNLYFTAARVLVTVLAGLSTATNAVITSADTVLSALGKLQAQISANVTAITGKLAKSANLSDVSNATTAVANLHSGFTHVDVALTTAQTLGIGSSTVILFDQINADTLNEYSASTGSVTFQSTGVYLVYAVATPGGWVDGSNHSAICLLDGVEVARLAQILPRVLSTSTFGTIGGSALISAVAGQKLTFAVYGNTYAAGQNNIVAGYLTTLRVWRIA